jgi:hypothetical protein
MNKIVSEINDLFETKLCCEELSRSGVIPGPNCVVKNFLERGVIPRPNCVVKNFIERGKRRYNKTAKIWTEIRNDTTF